MEKELFDMRQREICRNGNMQRIVTNLFGLSDNSYIFGVKEIPRDIVLVVQRLSITSVDFDSSLRYLLLFME